MITTKASMSLHVLLSECLVSGTEWNCERLVVRKQLTGHVDIRQSAAEIISRGMGITHKCALTVTVGRHKTVIRAFQAPP